MWEFYLAYCEAGFATHYLDVAQIRLSRKSVTIERTVTTTAAPEKVFPYLVDFRNATEWDSGTESCERVSGDGGPGTVYKNVSKFAGNTVELEYTVDAVEQPRFVIVGRNDTTTHPPSGSP